MSETYGHPPEPRWLTVSDMLALVVGFAVSFALPPALDFSGVVVLGMSLPAWFLVAVGAICLMFASDLATAAAVLLRCFEYHRMPRSAEWLVILLAMWMLAAVTPNVDHVVNWIYRTTGDSTRFAVWRWRLAGAGTSAAVAVVVIVMLRASRRTLPPWTKTILLAVAAYVLLWGPLPVLRMQFADLLPALKVLGDGWLFWLWLEGKRALTKLPLGLLLGVLATATIAAWSRHGVRPSIWTEWIGGVSAALLALGWLSWFSVFYFRISEPPPTNWICEQIVTSVGLLVVGIACWFIVKWYASTWNRWLGQTQCG